MPLGILNNIPSLAAENQLTLTSNALSNTLEQLSSGSRINSGADDPAGLSIANGLQANISALTQSVSNANGGVGQLQLADGALAQVTNLLNTAVTLATESATGTVSNGQRTAIQAEYASILAEINRIGTATTYNGQEVFQGGTATNLNAAASTNSGTTAPVALDSALTVGDATSVTAGGVTFTYTAAAGVANPNVAASGPGTALTLNTVLVTGIGALSVVHGGATTTFTTNATTTATVGDLINDINANANGADIGTGGGANGTITVAGAGPAGSLHAALVGGQLQITDTVGNNNLAVTGEASIISAGTTTFAASTAPTVQNLINAINADTTVGAKAALVGGQLQVTDPQNRADLAVTTDDTVLGAPVSGAPTSFVNTTTTAAATVNTNELASNAGTTGTPITAATVLTTGGVDQYTAGGRTFTFTAAAGQTVGALIAAINNPNDAAGLHAFLGTAGSGTTTQLIITDPNDNNDVTVGPGNTETVLGTFTNPSTTGSTATNIFLSDSTAIGSSQIAVTIGGLSTAAITNGSGGSAVNLSTTDLNTQTDAQTALTLINSAITNIASVRGTLGASVNRLTAASNVINSQIQNLTSAENTITAADIPAAVANLTKYSILEQTGISALAQANQQQQLVLKLLQ
jgi:flagellin